MVNKPRTERLGIAAVDTLFSQVGWLFREQPIQDVGIDAQVEVVQDNKSTGKLFALQVKSGESYFRKTSAEGIVYRPSKKHANYWSKYGLPVVVVLYRPWTNQLFWNLANQHHLNELDGPSKMIVPWSNQLTVETVEQLSTLVDSTPYEDKLNRLLLDLEWIRLVAEGNRVILRFEDWVNKGLSRTPITLTTEMNGIPKELNIPTIYTPGMPSIQIAMSYIPWAHFDMDTAEHRRCSYSDYIGECYAGTDEETGQAFYFPSFDEWYKEPDGIVPVEADAEVETYQVVVSLNELGNAFLSVAEYLFGVTQFDLLHFSMAAR